MSPLPCKFIQELDRNIYSSDSVVNMFLVVLMKDSNGNDVWFSHIIPDDRNISVLKDAWLLGEFSSTVAPSSLVGGLDRANRTVPQPLPAVAKNAKKKPITKNELKKIRKKIDNAKNLGEMLQ